MSIEKFNSQEKQSYTQKDLQDAKEVLNEAEAKFNSFDLTQPEVDMSEAMKAKANWERARKKYKEINDFLASPL